MHLNLCAKAPELFCREATKIVLARNHTKINQGKSCFTYIKKQSQMQVQLMEGTNRAGKGSQRENRC